MTSERMHELFDQSLNGEYDDEVPWNAISELRSNGSRETFEVAAQWLQDNDPLKKARGAAILSQMREPSENTTHEPKWLFRAEAFPLIANMLEREDNPLVLSSGVAALGFLYDTAAIPIIASYTGHPD